MLLEESQWRLCERQHQVRVQPWIKPRLERRRRGERDPVDDFLFEYYPYSPAKLATWHPGSGFTLRGDTSQLLAGGGYRTWPEGIRVDPEVFVGKKDRLDLAVRILAGTQDRPAMVNCFGLHEWAMVYRLDPKQIRHSDQPLRLSPARIAATVEDLGLRCTHIDAYRFFTDSAVPMNALTPTRASQPELEQPGCLHANMDMYKYAMWFQAYVGSELAADCFELAREARTLDMRASPYDMSSFGLESIPIEHTSGRAAYVQQQRLLIDRSEPLRHRLVQVLRGLQDDLRL